MQDASQVKTLDRLVTVLDCFTPECPTWSLAELSTQLDTPKSTLHRFLVGLETHGILRRDAEDKKWRLGYRMFIWGSLAAESTGLRHIARPVMHRLAGDTGETTLLTVYDNHEVICTDKVETTHHVRLSLEVGARRACHAGASSKILMAYLPEEEIQAIIQDKGLPQLCAKTITDPQELRAELARIRKHGYATSLEETDPDAWGVAAPIADRSGRIVGAIGVAGPTLRYDKAMVQRCATLCCQAAQEIAGFLQMGRSSRA